jgi:hypothetical protein
LQSITKTKTSSHTAIVSYDAIPWLATHLDTLADLHADAWGGLERFAGALANAGIVWCDIPGANDLFGSLDKAGVLAFRIRRELTEGAERRAA